MSYKLGPPGGNPFDRRPFQLGKASGKKNGIALTVSKEWLIDTGAQISVITKDNADQFDLTVVGGSASATTGGAGILVKSGLTMHFDILNTLGSTKPVSCSLDVGVKPDNSGSEILGMDQLADVGAGVEWEPKNQYGKLYEH